MSNWQAVRARWRRIIFGTNTATGRAFDVLLIACIIASVIAVMLDSIASINQQYGHILLIAEWGFTLLFTVEYLIRLWISERPLRYARSFFGLVDLLAVLPTYLSLFVAGAHYLLIIRVLRILRIFRIMKLVQYVVETQVLLRALFNARRKILVFMFFVAVLTLIYGGLMYLVEGPDNGFTSIPRSIYWAIVTITTVGYGDISPQTVLGQTLASIVMLTGYAIIAVPTGIVTAELTGMARAHSTPERECPGCHRQQHDDDAQYCKACGSALDSSKDED